MQAGRAANGMGCIESVGAGHAQIHHDEIRCAFARGGHRLLAVRGEQHLEADRLERLSQQHAVLRLIVHREHAQAPALRSRRPSRRPPPQPAARAPPAACEPAAEIAAAAGPAVDFDAPAHRLAELAADRQPETRARFAPLSARGLLKGREDAREILRRDADAGVLHRDAQLDWSSSSGVASTASVTLPSS
jgi:hypothetical protein